MDAETRQAGELYGPVYPIKYIAGECAKNPFLTHPLSAVVASMLPWHASHAQEIILMWRNLLSLRWRTCKSQPW